MFALIVFNKNCVLIFSAFSCCIPLFVVSLKLLCLFSFAEDVCGLARGHWRLQLPQSAVHWSMLPFRLALLLIFVPVLHFHRLFPFIQTWSHSPCFFYACFCFLGAWQCVQRLVFAISVQKYLWPQLVDIFIAWENCGNDICASIYIYCHWKASCQKIEKSNEGECLSYSNLDLEESNWAKIGFANYLKYFSFYFAKWHEPQFRFSFFFLWSKSIKISRSCTN